VAEITHNLINQTLSVAEQKMLLEDEITKVDHLVGFINHLLDHRNRDPSDILVLNSEDFLVKKVVEKSLIPFKLLIQSKGLVLGYELSDEVPAVLRGDPTRLRQILVNLIGHAIKYTDSGEIVISVTLQKKSEDTTELLFSVRDTGHGIPITEQRRIRELFSLQNENTTLNHRDVGTSLAISSHLVQEMWGRLSLASQANEVCTFSFTAQFGEPETTDSQVTHKVSHVTQ
jgi:two-component system, sensor histidine kinase and response regulator